MTKSFGNLRAFVASVILSEVFLGLFALLTHSKQPRVWRSEELPVAFWAWQNETPNQRDVQAAIASLSATTLFIRAGQIDFERSKLRRIREARGSLPKGIDVQLVYNATRSTLSEFERVKLDDLASVIADSFHKDCQHALREGALVAGLQLDFDIPTRLLPRYAGLIKVLREKLKSNAQVSITGLPTWMHSTDLLKVLREVSFWIPQFYGATIPERLDDNTPIASVELTRDFVERARRLNRPYYAGLSSYGYAIHYSREGKLMEVRGDLSPALVANNTSLELIERRPFDNSRKAGEWRYVYRARNDAVIDGLGIQAGEFLLLDVSSTDSLKECARTVREGGGETLLGLCIFRLPIAGDETNLSLQEVVSALKDEKTQPEMQIEGEWSEKDHTLILQIANLSTTSPLMGEDAMRVDLQLPEGILRGVSVDRALTPETLYREANTESPSMERRANLLRLKSRCFMSGRKAQARIKVEGDIPGTLQAMISFRTTDAQEIHETKTITINKQVTK